MKRVIPAALMLLLLVCGSILSAHAETTRVRVLLGKRELISSAVFDGARVLVPLSILEPLGVTYAETGTPGSVKVTPTSGASADVPTVDLDGNRMLALEELIDVTGGEFAWDPDKRTVKLTAHLQSVEFVNNTLRVNCSFPVVCSSHKWQDKIVVDIGDSRLASEAKEVYIGTALVSKARLGQPDQDNSRVVLDLAKDAGYKLTSTSPTAQIALLVDEKLPTPPPSKPAAASTSSAGRPYTIGEVRVDTVDEDRFNVVISTSGRAVASSSFTVDPASVTLKLEKGTLSAGAAQAVGTHPLLLSANLSQSGTSAKVSLDLTRIMAYEVNIDEYSVTLSLKVPAKAGGTLAGKLVVIDPGHGGNQIGARSGSIYEKSLNLAIARVLAEALENEGVQVRLTRNTDLALGLAERPQMAISQGADAFISLHCNSNGSPGSATGIETYYHMYEPSPRALAFAIHQGVCSTTGMCDRRARTDRSLHTSGLAVLRNLSGSGIPGILLECGYLNHASDRARLQNADYRKKLAEGIVIGLKAYFEGTPLETRR